MPFWFSLIYYWTEINGRNGLTAPFIIGAEQGNAFSDRTSRVLIRELIENIDNTHNENIVPTFFRCNDIGAHVFGLFSRINAAHYNGIWASRNENLLIAHGVQCDHSTEGLIEFIHDNYGDEIDRGFYSLNSGIWGPFTKNDRDVIHQAQELHSNQ